MDPNETLKEIDESIAQNDFDEVRASIAELYTWISKGGFEPNWLAYPRATEAYNDLVRSSEALARVMFGWEG